MYKTYALQCIETNTNRNVTIPYVVNLVVLASNGLLQIEASRHSHPLLKVA